MVLTARYSGVLTLLMPIMLGFIMGAGSRSRETKDTNPTDIANENAMENQGDAPMPMKGIGFRYPSRILERDPTVGPLPGYKTFENVHDWDDHFWRIVACLGEHFLSVMEGGQVIYRRYKNPMYSQALKPGLDELRARLEGHQNAKTRPQKEHTGICILHWKFRPYIWRMNPPDIVKKEHVDRLMELRRQAVLIVREIEALRLIIEVPPRGAAEPLYIELPPIIDDDLEFECIRAVDFLKVGMTGQEKWARQRMQRLRWRERDKTVKEKNRKR